MGDTGQLLSDWILEAPELINREEISEKFKQLESRILDIAKREAALELEIEDWEASFNLYDNAMRRATKMWQEASGHDEVPRVWPDGAKLMAWMLDKMDAGMMREHAEASGRVSAEGRIDFSKIEIWKLIYPYISEDNIAYTEENMEVLCENVLPKIYDSILHAQQLRGEEGHDAGREAQPAD